MPVLEEKPGFSSKSFYNDGNERNRRPLKNLGRRGTKLQTITEKVLLCIVQGDCSNLDLSCVKTQEISHFKKNPDFFSSFLINDTYRHP